MKSNVKKIVKNKSGIILSVLLFTMLISAVFVSNKLVSYLQVLNNPKLTKEMISAPLTSAPTFDTATKTITVGSQTTGYPWGADKIQDDDGDVDSTDFGIGTSTSLTKEFANSILGGRGLLWGTAFPRVVGDTSLIDDALKNADNYNLFLEADYTYYVPANWIWLIWGSYDNFEAAIHPHIYLIRIYYRVMAEAGWWPNILDQASNLALTYYDTTGNSTAYIVAGTPVNGQYYSGYINIDSGVIFDNVKNGACINALAISMYCWEPVLTIAWLNVDAIDIQYFYYKYDIDFYYALDYGSYGLGTIDQFSLKMDIAETFGALDVYLYNYSGSKWEKRKVISAIGMHTIIVDTDADDFFSAGDVLSVRFAQIDFYNIQPWTDYRVMVDQVRLYLSTPDEPSNVQIDQGYLHNFLTWDIPNDHGVPIIQYNVYRGLVENGSKTLVGSPIINEYNDTAIVAGTRYYYIIRAENLAGESDNSTEVSGVPRDQPYIEWLTPAEGAAYIFGKDQTIFNFTYDYVELYDVTLDINGTDMGSVMGQNSTTLVWGEQYNGNVTCTLYGFEESNPTPIVSDSRDFTFIKILVEVDSLLESNSTLIGDQLYLILHDPNGDHSYSSFAETTVFSLGVGAEISTSLGIDVKIGADFELFGIGGGASTSLGYKDTTEFGFDFRYEITESSSFSSNTISDNPDYIGPGYGDVYWGEAWIIKWELKAKQRVYSNATDKFVYEEPHLFYGIIRDAEVFKTDINAPEEWRAQNPVHNGYADVTWDRPLSVDSGIPVEESFEIETTFTRTFSHSIEISSTTALELEIVETEWELSFGFKNYAEVGTTNIYEVSFNIFDDEATDNITQWVGIDQKFGTYIFETIPFFCETSQPLEHNTYDYVPPEIEFPTIDLDSNNDGVGCCPNDEPIITVEIADEGGIQEAYVRYSTNNGSTWGYAYLTEQPGNPGTYETSLPAQPFNTTVIWYIIAYDLQGRNTTKYDVTGYEYEYTVIVLPEIPQELPDIPGYPIMEIIPIILLSVTAIVIIYYRKQRKRT
ncbi:MAG: hypothetical protein ACFFBW_15610 [Promethearchaeota archaeon]